MHVLSRGVTHNGLADFLEDSRFHHSAVESVPEIVKAVVADARAPDGRLPCRLDSVDRTALEGKDQPLSLPFGLKKFGESCGKRDFAGFAFGGFRVRDGENPAGEVDVFPPLREDLAPAHAGIERSNNDGAEMRRGRLKEPVFLADRDHEARFFPLPRHPHPAQGIHRDESFVDGPEEHAPQTFEVAVHGRVGE